eukprot:TRINITY_DN25674_c2_g1_i3.p1 TRINITY_DN25674_c2_g1~~TRINITY_DN25674_c2_g1_i3.p1  ORF type:complete len:290 (-),score=-15.00 TRINITY_DN25674_c2_g1_i3:299-1168(-)
MQIQLITILTLVSNEFSLSTYQQSFCKHIEIIYRQYSYHKSTALYQYQQCENNILSFLSLLNNTLIFKYVIYNFNTLNQTFYKADTGCKLLIIKYVEYQLQPNIKQKTMILRNTLTDLIDFFTQHDDELQYNIVKNQKVVVQRMYVSYEDGSYLQLKSDQQLHQRLQKIQDILNLTCLPEQQLILLNQEQLSMQRYAYTYVCILPYYVIFSNLPVVDKSSIPNRSLQNFLPIKIQLQIFMNQVILVGKPKNRNICFQPKKRCTQRAIKIPNLTYFSSKTFLLRNDSPFL